MTNTYKLIPLSEIDPIARGIAVKWIENYTPLFDIADKQKLASDFMNYAREKEIESREKWITDLFERIKHGDQEHQDWLWNEMQSFLKEKNK